jgi:hypothetical protein
LHRLHLERNCQTTKMDETEESHTCLCPVAFLLSRGNLYISAELWSLDGRKSEEGQKPESKNPGKLAIFWPKTEPCPWQVVQGLGLAFALPPVLR